MAAPRRSISTSGRRKRSARICARRRYGSSSSAETFQIGGQPSSGWRVIERRSDAEWLLFELDGTLIAAQSPSDELLAALAQLQPVTR